MIKCPKCEKEWEKEVCLVSHKHGRRNGEWWYRDEYYCSECGHGWVDEDCSI